MEEIKQDIFPVCSFGRAENIYYQSVGALCPQDLAFDEIIDLIKSTEIPIFPSHIMDREDWPQLLETLSKQRHKPRVQISLGREWEELSDKAMDASAHGWGLDILVDRSLVKISVPEKLKTVPDMRWIGCPLRFFDVKDLITSLLNSRPQREVALCFLEPHDKSSLLLNPDEVILLKKKLFTIYSSDILNSFCLILTPVFKPEENFYDGLSLKKYQENFVELGDYTKLRIAVSKSLKNYPHFFSMIIYICALFFSKAQRAQQIEMIYWKLFSALSWVRWIVGQIGWQLYSIMKWTIFIFTKIVWQLRSVAGIIKVGIVHSYWTLRRISIKIYRVAFWPIHKIYWISEYQYLKRVHPHIKGLFSND